MKLIFFTVLIGMCMFFFILSIVCVCLFVLFFLLNGFLEHSDSFCLSLSPHTEPFHFFVMLLKVFISFLSMSMVYLKLPFEYIKGVYVFLVIATASPSNKKIFSNEFLNELKDEIVGKLQRDQFSDKSMYYRLSLHFL